MNFEECVSFLSGQQRRDPTLELETVSRILDAVGRPQTEFQTIQIAGSNGKGSTAQMLQSVLLESGQDVGTFTSPSLHSFREQITVNGEWISKSEVVETVRRLRPVVEALEREEYMPTRFEILTAMALHHFAVSDVDFAILEAGLGASKDATSVASPLYSAVTSVCLEHTGLLGEDIEDIALDLATAAPKDRPVVTGAKGHAAEIIRRETPVIEVGDRSDDIAVYEERIELCEPMPVTISGSDWTVSTGLQLLGQHQAVNAGVAVGLARQIGVTETSVISSGLQKATVPGRFELVQCSPKVVLDGAHNPAAITTISTLLDRLSFDTLFLVFGVMADKEVNRMVSNLPRPDRLFATQATVDRAMNCTKLSQIASERFEDVTVESDVTSAINDAMSRAGPRDLILVTGSLAVVAEGRKGKQN